MHLTSLLFHMVEIDLKKTNKTPKPRNQKKSVPSDFEEPISLAVWLLRRHWSFGDRHSKIKILELVQFLHFIPKNTARARD